MNVTRCKLLLGTFVEVSVEAELEQKELIQLSQHIFERIEQIERLMSYYRLDSELNMLNREAHLRPQQVSDDLLSVLRFCVELSRMTDGVFDVAVAPRLIEKSLLPDHGFEFDETASWQDILINNNQVFFAKPLIIELGGVAKGFAVDEAIKAVQDSDIRVTVNAGGDLKMSHWQNKTASIRVPELSVEHSQDVSMQRAALACSGHYFLENETAITHPKKTINLDRKQNVSIFADSCMVADALTKVALLYDDYAPVFSHFNALGILASDSKLATI